jgi:flagellar biosynthesis/type III secretory pathway protein FliH
MGEASMKHEYWRRRDGGKKIGRFIKKDDRLLKNVKLSDFSFDEICSATFVEPDNINRNVIYADLHRSEYLDNAIADHEAINSDLRDPRRIPEILKPIDFTNDWAYQQERDRARRQNKNEDDDEFVGWSSSKEPSSSSTQFPENSQETNDQGPGSEDSPLHKGEQQADSLKDEVSGGGNSSAYEALDDVGQVINEINVSNEEQEVSPVSDGAADTSGDHLPSAQFIPMQSDNESEASPEQNAIDEYQKRPDLNEEQKAQIDQMFEDAKANGYKEGFSYGEEKGVLAAKQLNEEVSEKLSETISELSQLKKNILMSARQQITEVLSALSEVLVKRELSLTPELVSVLIEDAIRQGVDDDDFKILVNPETISFVKETINPDLVSHLKESLDVGPGDFRVESKISVIDGTITEIIKSVVEKLDEATEYNVEKAG